MISLGVLPVAMIPATCLLILTQNNRLSAILRALREIVSSETRQHKKIELTFYKRARFLQTAILCGYTATALFTLAAFFIILSTIAPHLLYIIVILLITGCLMTFLSIMSAMVEVSYATSLFNQEEDIFRKGREL